MRPVEVGSEEAISIPAFREEGDIHFEVERRSDGNFNPRLP